MLTVPNCCCSILQFLTVDDSWQWLNCVSVVVVADRSWSRTRMNSILNVAAWSGRWRRCRSVSRLLVLISDDSLSMSAGVRAPHGAGVPPFPPFSYLVHSLPHFLLAETVLENSWKRYWMHTVYSPTSIASNIFDSFWDFSTTFRRRHNLLFQFRLHIFRRRVGIFSHFFLCCFYFLLKFYVNFSSVFYGD